MLGSALVFLTWHFRVPLLRQLADSWEVSHQPVKADAILVLGGGSSTRPFDAAQLYQEGWAPLILVAQVEPSPPDKLGVTTRESDLSLAILRKLGVPETAIQLIGTDVASTHDEAQALRDWMASTGARTVLVPTDFTHSRRVDWLLRRTLPSGTQAQVLARPAQRYDKTNWWQQEGGLVALQNEFIKFAWYWWKYS